jgi:hypothetical protein
MIQIRRASEWDDASLMQELRQASAYAGQYRSILDGYAVSRAQIRSDHIYLA